MADQTYADSSGLFAPPSVASRRRLFDAMLQQGLDASPVQHWTQGLARLTQALVGGYGGYQADKEEREAWEKLGVTMGNSLPAPNLPTVGKPGTDTPAGPSPVATSMAAPPATGPSAAAPTGEYPGVRPGTPFTDRWRAFLDDLRARGVTVDPSQSGGYNPRNIRGTNRPSLHASDQAYDVNWSANPEGSVQNEADIARQHLEQDMGGSTAPITQVHPMIARELAQQHGMRWGGDFTGRSPDPMHFEIAGGVPMAQRSITARAGLPQREPQVQGWQGGPAVPGNSEGLLPFPLPPLPPETPQPAAPQPQRPGGMTIQGLMQGFRNMQDGAPPPPPSAPPTLMQESGPGPAAPVAAAPRPGAPPPATSATEPLGTASAVPGVTVGAPGAPMPPGAPQPIPAAPPAPAPAAPPAAAAQAMPANDVIRRLLQSRNPQAIQFGLQLYRDMARRGPTADYDFMASEGTLYRVNKRTGQADVVAGTGQQRPPEAIRTQAIKADQAYQSLTTMLDNYERLVSRTGMTALPGADKDAVTQARTQILLQLKELNNLGVLNGPDLELMNNMLTDTGVSAGNIWSNPADRVGSSVSRLKEMLRTIRNNQTSAVGMPPVQGGQQGGADGFSIRRLP